MNTVGTILAAATPPPTPLQFLQAALSLATVVLQIMVLFLAIRLGRNHTTIAFRYLMWACICYAVSEILVFATGFFPGFLFGRRTYFTSRGGSLSPPDFPDCVPRVSHTRDKMLYS